MAQRLLAVYGTLKAAYGNHRLIERAGLKPVGRAYTNDADFLMKGGGFPYVFAPINQGERIRVELYAFDDENQIADIDRLEGHPDWYIRKPFNFIVDQPNPDTNIIENESVTAEMYVQWNKSSAGSTYGDNTVNRDIHTNIAEWNR
jgi:gamma-glutamylcyclotransferase (GGCT)/AIG2-like uncharacterized protein YtfP